MKNKSKVITICLMFSFMFMALMFWLKQPAQAQMEPKTEPQTAKTETCAKLGDTTYCFDKLETLAWALREEGREAARAEQKAKEQKRIKITLTGYSSRAQETDDTPCIAADGSDICKLYTQGERICASNDFPMHSVITIDGVGDCIIRDRMNKRYTGTYRVDLYCGYATMVAIKNGIKTTYATIKTDKE